MKTRIVKLNFGRICGETLYRFVIEFKPHWWSSWDIRDWDSELNNIPKFYESEKEAIDNL